MHACLVHVIGHQQNAPDIYRKYAEQSVCNLVKTSHVYQEERALEKSKLYICSSEGDGNLETGFAHLFLKYCYL